MVWLIFLLIYIGFGLVILFFIHKVKYKRFCIFLPKYDREVITNIFIVLIFSLMWPALIVWQIREDYTDFAGKIREFTDILVFFWKERPDIVRNNIAGEVKKEKWRKEILFAVKQEDLVKLLSREEVEVAEKIFDPLGAVPDVPFGFLNAAWLAFMEQANDGDELWSFVSERPDVDRPELTRRRAGYVFVSEGKPGEYFLTYDETNRYEMKYRKRQVMRLKSREEIAQWYQKAAEQGDADAQYTLGSMYRKGDGVPQDYAVAVQWFQKAAEQGNPEARFSLGMIEDKMRKALA